MWNDLFRNIIMWVLIIPHERNFRHSEQGMGFSNYVLGASIVSPSLCASTLSALFIFLCEYLTNFLKMVMILNFSTLIKKKSCCSTLWGYLKLKHTSAGLFNLLYMFGCMFALFLILPTAFIYCRTPIGFSWNYSFMRWSNNSYYQAWGPSWKCIQPSLLGSLQTIWKLMNPHWGISWETRFWLYTYFFVW